ncbi:MAG: CHAT domain-containing protein, partial [Gemmatimonadaceae bacterium]
TPALFATEWALQFFPLLLSGTTVGEAMLATRRNAWTKWNNPLGLLYAVYCATDTRITPGLDVH